MKTARILVDGREAVAQLRDDGALQLPGGAKVTAGKATWLAPAHRMVICAALNHREQIGHLESVFRAPPHGQPPRTPVLFIKPENTITAHEAPVQHPDGVPHIECSAALAVVMRRTAKRVSAQDAFRYIKGYTLFNDFSLPGHGFFRPPVRTKCFDSFGPLGPCVVDLEDVPDPRGVVLRTSVNGSLRQEFRIRDLVRTVPELVSAITEFMTLEENDVIATGFAPGGVQVRAGDRVSVEADALGRLDSQVVSQAEYFAKAVRGEAA